MCGSTRVERLRPADAEQPTCDGVEPSDHQHQDGGEVKVPAQADLHEECPRVQVRLCVGQETRAGTSDICLVRQHPCAVQEQHGREMVNATSLLPQHPQFPPMAMPCSPGGISPRFLQSPGDGAPGTTRGAALPQNTSTLGCSPEAAQAASRSPAPLCCSCTPTPPWGQDWGRS